ncbi:MAG: hypothetical protein H6719_25900 [Sandaracinaceae bacterium]|nr:hypothetical protein [Sandaracinaceae bacterium]
MSSLRHLGAGLLLACAVGAGCDSGGPSMNPVATERGAGQPTDVHGAVPPPGLPAVGARDPEARHAPPPSPNPHPRPALPPAGGAGGGAAGQEPTGAAPAQDYSNALRTAFGTPTDCISAETRASLQGSVTVHVSVRATPSGRVTSATVSGNGLSSQDTACMTTRAERLQLVGPIEGAPRTITADITYTVTSTPGSPATAGGWETTWGNAQPTAGPLPSGAQAPGTVLPAVGATGRPEGSVAPSSTLPAIVE